MVFLIYQELAIHRISQQQKQNLVNLLRRKESQNPNWYSVQQPTRISLTPKESLALQQHSSQASVDSGSNTVMLTEESPTVKYLEEPSREKELEPTSKTNQLENENSKISISTKPSEATAETLNSKLETQRQTSVKRKQLEKTAKLVQSHHKNRDELRSAQDESAKEKQMRIETENRLMQANTKILYLSKQLKEKKTELLRYKTDREDHMKTQEDLKKQTQLNLDLSRQLSQANDKILTLTQRLETVARNLNTENKNSASTLTHVKQKNESKTEIEKEKYENTIKLFDNQAKDQGKYENKINSLDHRTKSRKRHLNLDDVEEEEDVKTRPEETKPDANMKKSASKILILQHIKFGYSL